MASRSHTIALLSGLLIGGVDDIRDRGGAGRRGSSRRRGDAR